MRMPNVDHEEMPELAALIERYAMRYEYRLDGSSLWEGRGRNMPLDYIKEVEQTSHYPENGRVWGDRMRRYPALEIPAGWDPLPVSNISSAVGCFYFKMKSCRALLAVNQMDVFITYHPTEAGYHWELDLVERVLGEAEGIVRPRGLFTGYGWVVAHRMNRTKVDGYWL